MLDFGRYINFFSRRNPIHLASSHSHSNPTLITKRPREMDLILFSLWAGKFPKSTKQRNDYIRCEKVFAPKTSIGNKIFWLSFKKLKFCTEHADKLVFSTIFEWKNWIIYQKPQKSLTIIEMEHKRYQFAPHLDYRVTSAHWMHRGDFSFFVKIFVDETWVVFFADNCPLVRNYSIMVVRDR